ncbi:monoacylglycerol lipase [Anaerolineales bacterium]
MIKNTNMFTNNDQQKIFTVKWEAENISPKGIVLIVHGYGEHIMRYEPVARVLTQAGYIVFGLDHRGHGQSDGDRAYFSNLTDLVEDIELYDDMIQAQYPDLPLFVWGHSMGSLISLYYALRHQDEMKGLILSGTAVDATDSVSKIMVQIGVLLSKIIPKLRLFPALPSDELSHDVSIVKAYDEDPLVDRGGWRIGTGIAMIQATEELKEKAAEIKLPILLLHGEVDKITPISGAKFIYEQVSSESKKMITYPNMKHEVMNEVDRYQVYADIINWLAEQE